jgi:competence protein ComEA
VDRIGRSQLVVYAAVGIALLIVGGRWLASSGESTAAASGVSFTSNSNRGGSSAGVSVGTSGEDVVVDVTGSVRDSGVYRLPAGARVEDAVKRAGGATATANLEAINLAAKLSDGQQVAVPAKAPTAGGGATAGTAATGSAPAPDAPISLGSATVADLDTIEGIGPVTAQNIIDFRDQNGGISSIDQLDQISGIGPATMEALRARLQP